MGKLKLVKSDKIIVSELVAKNILAHAEQVQYHKTEVSKIIDTCIAQAGHPPGIYYMQQEANRYVLIKKEEPKPKVVTESGEMSK